MPKPNRKTVEAWYDVFADMDPEEQAIAMRVLEQTHRLAKRAAPKTEKPGPSAEATARMEFGEER